MRNNATEVTSINAAARASASVRATDGMVATDLGSASSRAPTSRFCARNADEVGNVVKSLSAKGVKSWGRAVDVADPVALKGWIDGAAAELGGVDTIVCNVSALAVGDTPETWEKSFRTDMMHTVNSVAAARALSGKIEIGVDRHRLQRVGLRGRFRRRFVWRLQGGLDPLRQGPQQPARSPRASASTRCRRATPISKAASGRISNAACPISTRRRCRSIRPDVWARRRKSPPAWCFLRARWQPASPAPTSSSMVRSQRLFSELSTGIRLQLA